VDDYVTLSDIPGVQPNSTFVMTEAQYDEKSAKHHVHLLRDILSAVKIDEANCCLFPLFSVAEPINTTAPTTSALPHMYDSDLRAIYWRSMIFL
jgi:hypothetical protein